MVIIAMLTSIRAQIKTQDLVKIEEIADNPSKDRRRGLVTIKKTFLSMGYESISFISLSYLLI